LGECVRVVFIGMRRGGGGLEGFVASGIDGGGGLFGLDSGEVSGKEGFD